MKILVTGGAGFIGSHLCERLINAGHEVFCLDNFITGSRAWAREHLKGELIEHDLKDGPIPINLKGGLDQIYHLASPASPKDYKKFPIETLLTNSVGTKNALDLAKKYSAPILFTSTSEVYGDPLEHPQKESYFGNVNPVGERSCYDEGKRFAESLCVNYHKKYDISVKIVRIFNTYGPRMRTDDGRAIPEFIGQALKNQPLQVAGDGSQTRSFCYVDDMVDGLIDIMALDEPMTGPINLGNPEEITILNLAKKIIQLTKSNSKVVFVDKMGDDPARRCPDISLAHQKIGFNPKIPLEEGLQKTLDLTSLLRKSKL